MKALLIGGPHDGEEVDVPKPNPGGRQAPEILIADPAQTASIAKGEEGELGEVMRVGRYVKSGYNTWQWLGWRT